MYGKDNNLIVKTEKYKVSAIVMFTLFFGTSAFSEDKNKRDQKEICPTTQEYITTLEFVRAKKDQLANEQDARKLASQVAEGCKGSAKRFIRVVELLLKAGVFVPNAIQTGVEFSRQNDEKTEAFIAIFRNAFLEDYLDLDFNTAIKMAKSLTAEFDGNTKQAKNDFQRLASYCAEKKNIDLPLPQCAQLAARVTRLGNLYEAGIAKTFIKTVEFLRDDKKGPRLIVGNALKLSEEIAAAGPGAYDNFTQAYRYAVSKSGLNMEINAALSFAKEMTAKTNPKN